jgi:hypothetical protein
LKCGQWWGTEKLEREHNDYVSRVDDPPVLSEAAEKRLIRKIDFVAREVLHLGAWYSSHRQAVCEASGAEKERAESKTDCLYPQGLPKLLAADGSDSALPPLDHLLLDKAGQALRI